MHSSAEHQGGSASGQGLNPEYNDIWQRVCQGLRSVITPQEFETWFAPLDMRLEESQAVIRVPNLFFAEWIKDHYRKLLQQAVDDALGKTVPVVFERSLNHIGPKPVSHELLEPSFRHTPLNPRYTFDRFVAGPCNELALAACQAVADNPGKMYNPLFIFGGAGLGKTHLMTATGNHILDRFGEHRVHFCTSEAFTNELIQAVRFDGIDSFRDKYRQVDCLLLDDIQFLSGRERTQEEFFHTFNALYEAGKQIILTSDKMPREIPGLEKRLRSRFEWGLLADLQPPDEETKVAILQEKAAEQGMELSREVCFYLARQPESNVRVLEGYLTRLIAVSRFRGEEVTIDLVKQVITPLVEERQVSLEEVLKVVASHYGVKVSDLKSSSKTRKITHPRQVAMYLARQLTKASYPEIGRAFGNKDHSTVVKGVKKLKLLLEEDPAVAENVKAVERIIRNGESLS